MSSVTDQLIEIEKNNWPILRDLYKVDWPKHHVAYNIIQNYINWFEKDPNVKYIKVYSLNGDWSDGTFVIVDRIHVLFSTIPDNMDRLLTALNLLDKSKKFILFGFVERLLPLVQNLFTINKWPLNLAGGITVWHYIKQDIAKNFDVTSPAGTVLKQLGEEDAETVNEIWPHKHPGSINFIKRLIRYNLSMGLYKEDTGELIGWCLRLILGSLGILHIKDGYKRQGFGSLIVRKMSKTLADMNEDTTAPVVIENDPSRSMFKKLGFEEVGKNYWVDTGSSDPNFKWPEN